MIKHYFLLLLAVVTFTTSNIQAQCSGCTTTISNANSANQLVSSGQTLCITSTGTVSGLITVLAGGKVCNQGVINSTNVWVGGGTLLNSGTMNVNNLTVSSAGSFTNNASLDADSFLVISANANYYNSGTQTNLAFATADHASTINTGTITTNVLYDSIGDFINNGNVIVTDGFANGWGSYGENNGNISITHDFANGYNSTFINNKNMSVSRSFFNGNNSSFTTHCMVTVGQDWLNSATVLGPTSSCGGFNIGGISSNTGIIGSGNTHLDICDAGHPAGGFDANSGNVALTTTFCTCVNSCITVGLQEVAASSKMSMVTLYPNPAGNMVMVKYATEVNGALLITVKDMMGRTVLTQKENSFEGTNELQLNISGLAEGTYIFNISDSNQKTVSKLFNVVK
ncbi:MAG: T9SS type A sorting domain-containing protein [Bacteroidota bacterium]